MMRFLRLAGQVVMAQLLAAMFVGAVFLALRAVALFIWTGWQ